VPLSEFDFCAPANAAAEISTVTNTNIIRTTLAFIIYHLNTAALFSSLNHWRCSANGARYDSQGQARSEAERVAPG
jgi:hypothetical protein